MKDGAVLMYCKDGVLYPVALTDSENTVLQLTVASLFRPLNVIQSNPQGRAVNLLKGDKGWIN